MSLSVPIDTQQARASALRHYDIVGTLTETALERVIALAQRSFRVPHAFLGFIGESGTGFRAVYGLEPSFALDSALLEETLEHGTLVLPELPSSAFQACPCVSGPPHIRAYLGVSLKTSEGCPIGTLCVMDHTPRPDFDEEAGTLLGEFGTLISDELELHLRESALSRKAERLDTILASITQALVTFDAEWRFSFLNPQAEALFQRSRDELLGQVLWDVFPGFLSSASFENPIAALEQGDPLHTKCFFEPLRAWLKVDAYPSLGGVSVYLQNIGERRTSETQVNVQSTFHRELLDFTQRSLELGLTESFYQELLEVAVGTIPGAEAGSLLIRKGTKHYFAAAVGYDLSALQACVFDEEEAQTDVDLNRFEPQHVYSWSDDVLSRTQREVMEEVGRSLEIKVTLCVPIAVRGKTIVSLYLDNFNDKGAFASEATVMAHVLAQQAATVMQRLELAAALEEERQALTRLAHFDPLTNLPNRHLFDDRLDNAAAQARRTGKVLAVLLLGLDQFKEINEIHGHLVGDSVIAAAAARLAPLIREGDTLARWTGDEFIALFPHVGGVNEASRLARRMLQALQEPFEMSGVDLEVHASIGIALYPDEGTEIASDVVKHASIALYQTKKQRSQFTLFSHSLNQTLKQRVELEKELRSALAEQRLTLHYQPRVNLLDGSVTSVEALARWVHPARGFISPGVFIPLAEASGLIRELGLQVLNKACAQAKRWQREGLYLRVAVNLSVEQLRQPQIVSEIQGMLARHRLAARWLELEVTESTAMSDVAGNIIKLKRLRDLGVRLSIDDFGTAYSSLAYIEKLPVHCLKIDRSFLHDVTTPGKRDTRVVEAVLALARSFDLDVVAEGVETEVQRQTLLELGCPEAQGYLFAAPMDTQQATLFLRQSPTPQKLGAS